jgi:hypothetical protein
MAHYYFDVKNGTTERDHAGLELASDAAAVAQARKIADDAGRRPATHHELDRHVCVIHEDGHEVSRVRVAKVFPQDNSAARLKKLS